MSDSRPEPDDELVSAVADGEASAAESARVAADPRLSARLDEFFAVTDAVNGPVPLVDPDVRDRHVERALAAADYLTGAPPGAAPTAEIPVPPPPPPPVGDLAAARAWKRPPAALIGALSAAAVLLLLVVGAALILRADDEGGDGGDATAAAPATDAPTAAESQEAEGGGGGTGDDSALEFEDDDGEDEDSGDVDVEGFDEDDVEFLGDFEDQDELIAEVRSVLARDVTPSQGGGLASGEEEPADQEPCQEEFPVDTILLGSATLEGKTGLVYVEEAEVEDRQVWIVQPGAGECEDLAPVTEL